MLGPAAVVAAALFIMKGMQIWFFKACPFGRGWYVKNMILRLAPLTVAVVAGRIQPAWLPGALFVPKAAAGWIVGLTGALAFSDGVVRAMRFGGVRLLHEYRWGAFTLVSLGLVGALTEEVLFRGLLLSGFEQGISAGPAVTVQAVLFGLLHLKGGCPSGWRGAAFTTALGAGLGVLVCACQDLLAAAMIHGLTLPYLCRLWKAVIVQREF
jgi:membrane protease YdiL (CAAX protease family)